MFRRGERGIFVDDCSARDVPWVVVVAAAKELPELRPRFERGQRRVRRNKPFALVTHECRQVGTLLRVERHFAMPEEEDRIDVRQVWPAARRRARCHQRLLRDDVRVGADVRVVSARLVAQPLDDGQRVRDGIMLCDTVPRVGPGKYDFPCAYSWRTASSTASTRRLIREYKRAEQEHAERRYAESHL